MAGKSANSEKMTRTSISLPEELKEEMDAASNVNWSAFLREAISNRLKYETERNIAEALLLNEKLRRKASRGWDSTKVIRYWRDKRR
jgi:Arc/MetJ-type ribon-helix-helix transcriptional regulator